VKNLLKLRPVARFALAFSLLCCGAALAAPALTGLFSGRELGLLEFSTGADGKVVAKFKRGGSCNFKPDIQVINGSFEGNVFVGTVLLCQEGPSCDPEHSYPFLGVWTESSLSGDIKLDSACHSPGLAARRLNIAVASADERNLVRQDAAVAVANAKPMSKREMQDAAEKALLLGQKKAVEGDFRAAAQNFERGISYAEDNWAAYSGLGYAELKLKNTAKAIESFQRAVALTKGARVSPEQLGDLLYNLACAQSAAGQTREAVATLSRVSKLLTPAQFVAQLDGDTDLDPLRNEPEFRRLLADARIAREKANRKRTP
jgi:hypothetical protein